MLKFLSLSSGSNGNSYYIGNKSVGLLVDAGIGYKTIKKRLQDNGIDIKTISMILVTHDHGDHIKYLAGVAEKLSVPVFTTSKLHNALSRHFLVGDRIAGCKRVIRNEILSEHRGINFLSFEVPHDATQTLGYYIELDGVSFVIMTDLGDVPDGVIQYCLAANHIIIESNYDVDMLMRGSYSPELKLRILKEQGHLSNDKCAEILKRIYHKELRSIYLCHLSENNNTPECAYESASMALEAIGVKIGEDVNIHCLPRRKASEVFNCLL